MSSSVWEIMQGSYDPYSKKGRLMVRHGKETIIAIDGLDANNFPSSEDDQQRELRTRTAALLRGLADFLEQQ